MLRFFIVVVASLLAGVAAQAAVPLERSPHAVFGEEEGLSSGLKETRKPPAKRSVPLVEVRLDAQEAVERLQERQIKTPRHTLPVSETDASAPPER